MGNSSAQKTHSDKDLKRFNYQDAQKSLNTYINQLEFHFDLSGDDIVHLLELALKSRKKKVSKKKWWQMWK